MTIAAILSVSYSSVCCLGATGKELKKRACFKSSSATQIGWSFKTLLDLGSCFPLQDSVYWTPSLPLWARPLWLTLPLPSLDRKANIHFFGLIPSQYGYCFKKSLQSKELHNSSDFHQELTNDTLRDLCSSTLTYLLAVWPLASDLIFLNPTFFN